jgi:hypothetical protein
MSTYTKGPAYDYQQAIAERYMNDGYQVEWEVQTDYQRTYTNNSRQPQHHRGYIDLVATRDGYTIAIECDRQQPRRKSIEKLNNYPCNEAWVYCRETGKKHRIK